MGKIIARKIRGMNLWYKVALITLCTLLTSVFMYEGLYKPLKAEAAAVTYYMRGLAAVSVGNDGSTNVITEASGTYDYIAGSTNQFRAITNNTAPAGTVRNRIRSSAGAITTTGTEIARVYTPAYASARSIAANATTHITMYMRTVGTSASVYAQLYEYNDSTGIVGAVKGSTPTQSISQASSNAQEFNLTFNNTSFSVASGNRLVVYYFVNAAASDPSLLYGAVYNATTPAGSTYFTVDETAAATPPTIATVSPNNLTQGVTNQSVTITGTNLTGGTVSFSNTSVTGGTPTVTNATTITLPVSVAANATVGAGTVTVTTTGGSVNSAFTVNSAPSPTVTSTSPNNMTQGTGPTTVTINGTNFLNGATVLFSGTGLTQGAVTYVSATQLSVPITVAAGATTGARNVTVTLPGGQVGTGTGVFTVNAAATPPTISTVSPNSLVQGTSATSVTITGTNLTGGTVTFSNPGVTAGAPTVANATTITLPVTVTAGAAAGAGTVTVSTGSGSANSAFTVTAAPSPTVTSTSPNNMTQGAGPSTITINGTNFLSGSTVLFSGTGLTQGSVTYVSATQLQVPITVAAGATTGARNVTVTLPGGQAGTGTGVFTVNAAASCTPGTQTLSIAPSASNVLPSGVATYTVTVTNGDSGGACTNRAYTLTRGTPSNSTDFVTSALSKTALSVPAGGTDFATYTVTANAGAANGVQNTVSVSTTGTTPTSVNSTTTVSTFSSPLMHNQINTQSTKNGTWGNNKDCSWCHTDVTTNIKRVAQSIIPTWTATARNVIFNKITSSVPGYMGTMGNDGRSPNTTSTNVCEVCHTQTKYHQYSAVGTTPPVALDHYNNKDCVSCHAHNKAFKASCAGCHLATPTSGSHTAHAVTKAMLCATCHVNAVGSGTAHNNTIHSLGFQINGTNVPGFAGDATTRFATYSASTSSPAQSTQANTSVSTSVAGRGSCNLYCHGNWTGAGGTLNPVWGGGATQDACGTCHAATITPNQPTAWPITGAHARHAGSAANQMKLSCDKCHGVHTDASHVTGTVKFDVSGISGTAQYRATTGTTSYAITGATAALAPSATYGQCTNMYCHSSAQNPTTGSASGTVYAAPTWATAPTLSCGDCHSNMKTVGATGGSLSSHNEHANAATNNYDCSVCHAGYNATTAAYPAHVNSAVDVTISATYGGTYNGGTALNNGYSTCNNTYCHSNGTNTVTPAANTSVTWGGTSTCSSCHGFPPAYTSGSPKANSHVQHVTTGGYTCDYCHVKTTATGSTIASRARHANMFYNVSGNTAKLTVANFTYASAGKTCSTSQCHTAVMTWGSNSTANTCTKCHGTLTTAAVVTNAQMAPSTNAHQAHVHGATSYSYSSELTCYECHNSGATANFTGHMNGTPAVVFTNASTAGVNGTATNWASAAKTCSVYCHGVAMPKGDTGGTGRTPAWTNAAYMSGAQANDCSRCHGFPPTTGTTVTTHASYVAQPNSCTTCHVHFNNTNGFANEADRRLHIDGVVQAKGDCNSCHDYDTVGAVYTTNWSGGYWGKSPQASPNGYGDHAKHINYIKTRLSIVTDLNPVSQVYGAAGSENLKVCGTCHTTLAADHMAGGRMIFSQSAGNHPFLMGGSGGTSLLFGATNPAYNAGAKTCSNLSCHYFTTPTW